MTHRERRPIQDIVLDQLLNAGPGDGLTTQDIVDLTGLGHKQIRNAMPRIGATCDDDGVWMLPADEEAA